MKNRFLNRLNRAYSILRGDQDIVISHKPAGSSCSGYVLMSHIPYVPPSLRNTQWHSNIVEYFELIKIFTELGYEVDSIRYDDINFIPSRRYDIFLDVAYNLQRLSPLMSENTVKILYLTTSYIRFANNAELRRVNEFEKRKGCTYSPSVFGPFEDLVDRSLRIADKCILIGNQETKNTFPAEFRNKIKTVTVSASRINRIKKSDEYIPEEKEFLWFFGLGAVHKGLDLVLDAFARNRTWKLNVIGYVDREPGFKKVYEKELTSFPNIKYHGALNPSSDRFAEITGRCFAFIAPTCSEGISPAVATLLQVGLYPIISRHTGIDLPEGYGVIIDDFTVGSVEHAVREVQAMDDASVSRQISDLQSMALENYTLERYTGQVKDLILKAISEKGS